MNVKIAELDGRKQELLARIAEMCIRDSIYSDADLALNNNLKDFFFQSTAPVSYTHLTLLSLFTTITTAYPLSKPGFKGRRVVSLLYVISME